MRKLKMYERIPTRREFVHRELVDLCVRIIAASASADGLTRARDAVQRLIAVEAMRVDRNWLQRETKEALDVLAEHSRHCWKVPVEQVRRYRKLAGKVNV